MTKVYGFTVVSEKTVSDFWGCRVWGFDKVDLSEIARK